MAFNFLENRLNKTIKKAKSRSVLDEANINELLEEIRLILLESDVNLDVANGFIDDVKQKSIGSVVDFEKTTSQELLSIINDELTSVLGGETVEWKVKSRDVVMMVGLQGSGKTTSSAKLSNYLSKKKGFYKKPLLVGLDVYRPAAIEQLEKLAKDLNIEFYSEKDTKNVKRILKNALAYAKFNDNDLVILDTAGRLQTDTELMEELKLIKKEAKPTETIFVADALSGQELINVAEEFNNQIKLTSAIITKLDSDAKGGAALSLSKKIGVPINFIGTGEKVSDLEKFHPDRMAGRILGLGDIKTLTEKAQEVVDENQNERMLRKMISGKFDLNDLMESMEAVKKMGSLSAITQMLPGNVSSKQTDAGEKRIQYFGYLLDSMTEKEKKNPKLLKHPKRKERIINGSGRNAQEYNILIRDFDKARKQMKEMAKLMKSGRMPDLKSLGM